MRFLTFSQGRSLFASVFQVKLFSCWPLACVVGVFLVSARAWALGEPSVVSFAATPGAFALADARSLAALHVDATDYPGVQRAAGDLQADIERVTGRRPDLSHGDLSSGRSWLIVGTLGHSPTIDALAAAGKIDVSEVRGRWEAAVMQLVEQPAPGVERALVIAGSDKRGTIFALYSLSEQIGVSPWYWWADVPPARHDALYVQPIRVVWPEPAVKYRGIFLNDEAPALTGWAKEKFGGLNHDFYSHVFELLLRLRANYLWPAMWNNAFNEDDPLNPKLADEYGIVMGTSHHEPMLRAQQEWKRHGKGPWNYEQNAENLRAFWTEGIRRNRAYESIITIGMRGDGDLPMSEESNVALLQGIVAAQRKILEENYPPENRPPQMWALYKEVQDYYEKGMRVPDDVTLLWCDDNWGNIRRLPTAAERKRSGGAGVYYHFDYVGGPRSYKWINTVPITKVWEQMNLAWTYGADRVWIVNVGDLKPIEFPIEFFLTFARAPQRWPAESLADYTRQWSEREFGAEHAAEIAALISGYTKINGRRKPELLEPNTYSLVNYGEAQRAVAECRDLLARAERVNAALPEKSRDAFFQLVLHPIKAIAIVNELYVTAGLNGIYAVQGRASTNTLADRARQLFRDDEALTRQFNQELGGGRWNHFMDQTHLGYTYWQQPPRNVMPAVREVQVTDVAEMGVGIEGSALTWDRRDPYVPAPILPPLDPLGTKERTIEVFNRGRKPFTFEAKASAPWLRVTPAAGEVTVETKLTVSVDWTAAPKERRAESVVIRGLTQEVEITVPVAGDGVRPGPEFSGFVESERWVSIEAEHFQRAVSRGEVGWKVLPGFGRTLSGVTPWPQSSPTQTLDAASPRLEYNVFNTTAGQPETRLYFAPSLAFQPGPGLRCAVSFDDEAPQIVRVDAVTQAEWGPSVEDAIRVISTKHKPLTPGPHTLKVWMIDPGVVLEKVVIDLGGLRPSYLGPPESARIGAK